MLTIGGDAMSSNHTRHTAHLLPGQDKWEVSWLPGQTLSRSEAVAAMRLADAAFCADMLDPCDGPWGYIRRWAAELGMTPYEALNQADITPAGAPAAEPPEPDGSLTPFWNDPGINADPFSFSFPEPDSYELEPGE